MFQSILHAEGCQAVDTGNSEQCKSPSLSLSCTSNLKVIDPQKLYKYENEGGDESSNDESSKEAK